MAKIKGGISLARLFLVFLLACFIGSSFVYAADDAVYNKQKAVDWLKTNVNEGVSVSELSLSMLAMRQNGVDVKNYMSVLDSKRDIMGCFPKGNCNPKDTAFAILALKDNNKDYSKSVKWLNDNIVSAGGVNGNEWSLQIVTDGSGDCSVFEGNTKKATITVDGNSMLKVGSESMHWVSLNKMGITLNQPLTKIKVDCKAIDEGVVVSLIRIKDKNFYIEQESSDDVAELTINRACYGSSGSCSKQGSFYVAWVFKEIGEDIQTLPYLEESIVSPLDYAIMQIIKPSSTYSKWLKDNQENDHWEDIYSTSFAAYSLKNSDYEAEMDNAVTWLNTQQNADGSSGTDNKIMSTSSILYLVLGNKDLPISDGSNECVSDTDCSNGQTCDTTLGTCSDESGNTPPNEVCGDNVVEGSEECDGTDDGLCANNCGNDCKCITFPTVCTDDSGCDIGQRCGGDGECYSVTDCVSDTDCKSGETCDPTIGMCSEGGSNGGGAECTAEDALRVCEIDEECDESIGKCVKKQDTTPSGDVEDCTNGIDDDKNNQIDCDDTACAEDAACISEKKGGSSWWIWLIVFLIVLIGGGLFVYGRLAKPKPAGKPDYFGFGGTTAGKKDEKPKPGKSGPMIQRPSSGFNFKRNTGGKDMELESKLDKSIKDVESILKRGK